MKKWNRMMSRFREQYTHMEIRQVVLRLFMRCSNPVQTIFLFAIIGFLLKRLLLHFPTPQK